MGKYYCVHSKVVGNNQTEATLTVVEADSLPKDCTEAANEWCEYYNTYKEALAAMPTGKEIGR